MKRVKKYKVNTRKLFVNILFLLVIFIIFNLFTSQTFGRRELKTKNVTIKSGDTLWTISQNICKNDSSLNIQEVIYDIKEINSLETNTLISGDILQVPIYN